MVFPPKGTLGMVDPIDFLSLSPIVGEFNHVQFFLGITSGWWLGHPSEKNDFVNWDDDIPNINGKMPKMFTKPPSRHGINIHPPSMSRDPAHRPREMPASPGLKLPGLARRRWEGNNNERR